MNADPNQVPSPPTWREYLDARLATLATKDDLNALRDGTKDEMNALRDDVNERLSHNLKWTVTALLSGLAVATTVIIAVLG